MMSQYIPIFAQDLISLMPSLNPNIKVGYLDEDSTVNHPLLLGIHWSNLKSR
jgi:hypothetical protein